jgi:HTH-type transcriptional regulator, glycine betaine synthesis regulator
MSTEDTSEASRPLWPSELAVTDVIGRLIEFWGFKRNMGRVWALLYLSPNPMTAQEIRDGLVLSAGAVSMTLGDRGRWGVVRKVWIQGDRRDHFTAEVHLWRMISRVFRERELAEINAAMEAFEQALASLEPRLRSGPAADRKRADLQIERNKALLDLAKMGKRLLEGLLATAKIDAEALARFVLSGSQGR